MLLNPTAQILPWDSLEDPAAYFASNPYASNSNAAGHAPSPDSPAEFESFSDEDSPVAVADAFSCDHFRMFDFKVRTCARGRSHDWTKCPYAHPGEKARRRDPRKFRYSGAECPDLRQGFCKKGDTCEFAHGVFESWLHPDRYRTQACRDGMACRRRVCFFAHSSEQLRIPSKQSIRSPLARGKGIAAISSPTSILISPTESPPMSPTTGGESLRRLAALMQNLQVDDLKLSPPAAGLGCPRVSCLRWERSYEEEPAMERVESGRNLRTLMYAKLMRENSVEQLRPLISAASWS